MLIYDGKPKGVPHFLKSILKVDNSGVKIYPTSAITLNLF
jgi:hypothetical protein